MPGLPHRIGLVGATESTRVKGKRTSCVSGRSKMLDLTTRKGIIANARPDNV